MPVIRLSPEGFEQAATPEFILLLFRKKACESKGWQQQEGAKAGKRLKKRQQEFYRIPEANDHHNSKTKNDLVADMFWFPHNLHRC